MTRRSLFLVLLAFVIGAVAATAFPVVTTAGAVVTRELTLAGTDFESLDHSIGVTEFPATGGAVAPVWLEPYTLTELAPTWFLESNVTLPVGAKVIEVTLVACGGDAPISEFYFGSYAPTAGTFAYHLSPTSAASANCPTRTTFKKTGNPIATIAAGRRYTLGYEFVTIAGQNARPKNDAAAEIIHGAKIKYTCATAC